MKRAERIEGTRIKCYDLDDGVTFDRYTVVFMDEPYGLPSQPTMLEALAMSTYPFHPQGFGQHTCAEDGGHLGKRIRFKDLPEDCQTVVLRDIRSMKEQEES